MSAGWQSSALHIASRVEKRIAFALPVFNIERFAGVMPIRSASSNDDILRLASITSTFTIIAITSLFIRLLVPGRLSVPCP